MCVCGVWGGGGVCGVCVGCVWGGGRYMNTVDSVLLLV